MSAPRPKPGKPPTLICPACGRNEALERLIGDGYQCGSCGHMFRVINGRAQDFEDDDAGE